MQSVAPLETQVSTIEAAFQDFTERKDIAILLINQHVRLITHVSTHNRKLTVHTFTL